MKFLVYAFAMVSSSFAFGAPAAPGGLNLAGPPSGRISYDGIIIPAGDSPTLTENRAEFGVPVVKAESSTVAASLGAGQLHLSHPVYLDSGAPVPTDLYRVELGAQYFRQLREKKSWGLRASIGYAGDKPSVSPKDATYGLLANYGFPGSGKGYWVLMVFVSNNSSLLNYLPIPGFLYIYRTPKFTGLFGFPIFSLQWTPTELTSYSFSIFGTTLQAEAAFGHRENFQVFTDYALLRQSYIPDIRPDSRDRLNPREQRLGAGFRTLIAKTVIGELRAGRSFNRSFSIGQGPLKRDGGSVSLEDEWYISWGGKYAF